MATPEHAQNFTSSSQFGVQANVHQATGALVVTAPHRIFRLPPTSSPVPVPSCLTLPVNAGGICFRRHRVSRKLRLSTGGGADYDLSRHFTLRAEYRGFVYGRPDFDLAALHSGTTTHTAQPSAGIVFASETTVP